MQAFVRRRAYTGPVRAVVLDWAGTAVDYGCRGPAAVFVEAFARFREAGAHYVAEDIGACPPLIEAIGERLARGEQPLTACG